MGHSCNKLRLFAQVRQMIASNLLQCGTMGHHIYEYGHKYIGEQVCGTMGHNIIKNEKISQGTYVIICAH